MLCRGADPSIRGDNNFSPLHMAAIGGNVQCVELLLNDPWVDVDEFDDDDFDDEFK